MFNLSDWQAGVPIPPESPVAIAVFFSGSFNLPYSPKPHRSITTGIRQIKTRESSQALLFFSPDYSLFYSRFMRLFEKNGLLQTVTVCYKPSRKLKIAKKNPACSAYHLANRAFPCGRRDLNTIGNPDSAVYYSIFNTYNHLTSFDPCVFLQNLC